MNAEVEVIVRSLAAWRGRHLRKAWRPVIASEQYAWQTAGAQFGGIPLLKPGEPWPRCPACQLPLRLMIQVDLAHLPAGLFPLRAGLLQYFQCADWPSCAADSPGPLSRGQLARIIENIQLRTPPLPPDVRPHPLRAVARWNEFCDLPSPQEHERLGLEYTYEFLPGVTRTTVAWPDGGIARSAPVVFRNDEPGGLAEAIAQAAGGDKLGGWPRWVQDIEYPRCPECGMEMQYLLQLDWHDNVPESFGDLGTGHLSFCPSHPTIVAFASQCS